MENKVIYDNETKEYKQGWNANNRGSSFLSNPYGNLAYDGELYRLWQKGFNDNFQAWESICDIPKSFSKEEIDASFTITDPKNHITS